MRIHMPEENWLAMLEFVPRRVLGNKVDKIGNRYFARIAQDCLHAPFKHIRIGDLYISTGADGRAELRKGGRFGEIVPIADVDMPENIRAFDNIYIRNLDAIGLEFLGRMRALFHNNVAMDFEYLDHMDCPELHTALSRATLALRDLLPLLTSGPVELIEVGPVFLPVLRQSFSAIFFNTTLMEIWITKDITNNSTTADVFADWLLTPRGDGQPRVLMLSVDYDENNDGEKDDVSLAIERAIVQQIVIFLQTCFVNPARQQQASPFSVIVRVCDSSNRIMELDLIVENDRTGEKLIMRGSGDHLVVLNCAIDTDQEWIGQKEREMIDLETLIDGKKLPTFHFT